jgi:hypothetical protein
MRNSICWRSAVAWSICAVTILAVTIIALPAAAASSGPGAESTPEKPGTAAIMAEHSPRPKALTPAKTATAHQLAFRNAVVPAPPGWTGPVFHLSHAYPLHEPAPCPKEVCKWLDVDVDFSTDLNGPPPTWDPMWEKYLAAILDYVKEGQDPELRNEIGWRVKVGKETRWFHVPWMAYDPTQGREYVHGMTNERTARLADFHGGAEGFAAHLLQLAPKDVEQLGAAGRSHLVRGNLEGGKYGFETWAFGMYNAWGA